MISIVVITILATLSMCVGIMASVIARMELEFHREDKVSNTIREYRVEKLRRKYETV